MKACFKDWSQSTLCLLGIFLCFLSSADFFFKSTFSEILSVINTRNHSRACPITYAFNEYFLNPRLIILGETKQYRRLLMKS